jgi:hypothetical protein
MDKIEYRAVIKFFVKEGLTPYEIHSKFINVYRDSSPSFSTIKKWAAEFERCFTNREDGPREGVQKVQQHQKSLNKCTIWYWMTGG